MVKKLLACMMMLLLMSSGAWAEPYMWAKHESLAGLTDGHSDYSQARFSQIYVTVSDNDVQFTEEISKLPGTFTISGGNYSFWNGQEMQKVSEAPHTFKLGSTYGIWGYELYRDDGQRTRLCLEADNGLNGINANWSVPDMPSLSGQATFPNYRTTQEQLDSFVPYIEFIRSGSKVTGLNWRVVNPSDTSKPVSQDFNMEFQVDNASRKGWDEFYWSPWVQIPAGETPEGTLTFYEPIEESEIWLIEVNLNTFDEDAEKIHTWKFSRLDEPELSLWSTYESDAKLIDGKSDYSDATFYGLTLTVETDNSILAEAKHFTDAGRITISGGGYTLRDDDTEEIIASVDAGKDMTFNLGMYRELHIDKSWLEYGLRNGDSRVVVLAGGAETELGGRTVTWTFPAELNMDGSATIPRYKSVSEQLASCVPYIEVTSEDGKITAVNYKLVNPQDTSTALQPSYRTDFKISILHSDGSSILRSSWYNNTNQGTWTLDEPEALSNVSFILVRVQYHESGNEFLDYQWDFAPVSAPAPIEITTTSLPNGTKETPYTVTLAANVSGATWSVSSGTLPAGLTLDPSTGEISGIPTSSGAFTFTLTASNSAGSDSRTFMLTIESVAGAPMITTPQDLGTFQHLQDVSVQLEATGATPITWTAMGLPSWLTFDAESATISGTTPSRSGETSFTVVAANAAGKDSRKFTLKVKSSTSEITAPSITTASLDDGKAGELYNVTLDATGTSPLTWTATGLPDGLTLNTSGKLTGVPKVSGTFTVVVTAENSVGNDTKEYTLTIAESDKVTPPKITTETLDEATAGEAYSFQFKAEGKSITWTATWKTLTGLTFSPGGLLTGTPKTAGTYNITVKAKNTAGTDYANLTLKVNSTGSNVNAPVVKSSKIPDAYQGEEYSYFLEAEGTGLKWKLADGESLPGGLELTEEGEVTGRVETSKATTFKFNVIASNSAGSSKAKQISLRVVANAPEFKSYALKEAKWNKKYSYTLKVKNMKPTVWSIEGDLPEGVKFDKGKFSGKPTEAGEFELTISASNGAVEISDEFTLNVKGVTPKIKGSFKKGTEGEAYRSVLKATGVTPLTWDFEDLPDGLDFTTNATGEECTIFGTPEKLFSGKIQVTVENGSGDDQSYSKGMKMTIKAVKPKFSTTISDIPDGVVGEMYSCQLKLSTNNAEVIWSYSGEMPEGLTMDEDTGLIYGVPMKAGENFKIKVTAANANKLSYKSTQTFYISIKEAPASDKPEEPEAPEFENGVASHERDALSAETLAVIANNDEVIAAVLPALEVEEAGIYEFAVSLDVNVPEGGLLVWHSFPDGEDDEGDNDNAVFLDEDGEAIERVPETYSVTVSAWLEPGIIYEPIIAVKIRE